MRSFLEDPMWLQYQQMQVAIRNDIHYGSNPIVSYINRKTHSLIEGRYLPRGFGGGNVLEVGAGSGEHLKYCSTQFDSYLLTDISSESVEDAKRKHAERSNVICEIADACELPYGDNSFDRLISVANLEHLPFPHLVLKEWRRLVRHNGLISITIPTEGGIAWGVGRWFTTRRSFAKLGLDLDYLIAREHINCCSRLVSLIRHEFPDLTEVWFPTRIPSSHLNLLYACQAIVKK